MGKTEGIPPAVELLKTELGKGGPSSVADSVFSKIVGPGHAITCNRPFESDTIPIVLLHEVFSNFKQRCKQAPSQGALAFMEELVPIACKWHGSEESRQSEILSVLGSHTGFFPSRAICAGHYLPYPWKLTCLCHASSHSGLQGRAWRCSLSSYLILCTLFDSSFG